MSPWEDNSRLEAELGQRMTQRAAPVGFAGGVMAAVRANDAGESATIIEFKWRPKLRIWAAVAASAASLAIGFGVHHRIQVNEQAALAEARADEARLAESRLAESLQLAGITLNRAHSIAFGAGELDGE